MHAGERVTIRPAAIADAPSIAALSGELGYLVEADAMNERLARLLRRASELVAVAETGPGQVVAWVHASDQELLESGRRCEILGLVVAASCRGRGIGRQLVAAVEAWATRRAIDEVAVRSNVVRTGSHPFYERLGYERVKTQHAYRKRLR